MSSREHGRGSGRNNAPESAVLATISSASAMDKLGECRDAWSRGRRECVAVESSQVIETGGGTFVGEAASAHRIARLTTV